MYAFFLSLSLSLSLLRALSLSHSRSLALALALSLPLFLYTNTINNSSCLSFKYTSSASLCKLQPNDKHSQSPLVL